MSDPDRKGPGDRLVLVTVVVLLAVEAARQWLPQSVDLVAVPLMAVVILLAARRLGIRPDQLGLGRGWIASGAKPSAVLFAALAGGVALLAWLPVTHSLFQDSTYRSSVGHALLVALLVVPLGTVLIEEVAFRGALLGGLSPRFGQRGALWLSALLFGIWHSLSSARLADANAGVGDAVGRGTSGTLLAVAGTIVFTGLAGAVLGWLRLRYRSLLPAIVGHWTANGAAIVAIAVVWSHR